MIISVHVGIALAFVAMLCWGFGDFFIQKSTRKVGDIESLFLLTLIGVIILFPFVVSSLPQLLQASITQIVVLGLAAVIFLVASILDFEALRAGKLSVVEPVWTLEIPVAAFLALLVLRERIDLSQIVLIVILILSLFLVSWRSGKISKKILLEKGFFVAIVAAIVMGAANFFLGWGARVVNPIMVNFVIDLFMMTVTGLMLISRGHFLSAFKDFGRNVSVVLPMGIADKVAYVAFAFSMVLAPIAIAVALSESYIIVAVIFGLVINKEKLKGHQWLGLIVAIVTALTLAAITK